MSATGTTPPTITTSRTETGARADHRTASLKCPLTSADICSAAVPMLQDLLCPALELIDHILENGLTEQDARVLTARVKIMRAKRDELSDYIALLTRFANSAAPQQTAERASTQTPAPALRLDAVHSTPCRAISWTPAAGATRGEMGTVLHGHHHARAPGF